MTHADHNHDECLDRSVFELTISRDGVVRAASDGSNPRLVAQMLRKIADSLEAEANEQGLAPLPELEAELTRVTDPEEAEALISRHRASDPRSTANLN